jgi:hypothetical protein
MLRFVNVRLTNDGRAPIVDCYNPAIYIDCEGEGRFCKGQSGGILHTKITIAHQLDRRRMHDRANSQPGEKHRPPHCMRQRARIAPFRGLE